MLVGWMVFPQDLIRYGLREQPGEEVAAEQGSELQPVQWRTPSLFSDEKCSCVPSSLLPSSAAPRYKEDSLPWTIPDSAVGRGRDILVLTIRVIIMEDI